MDRSMNEKKQELIRLLNEYIQDLSAVEYNAEVKDALNIEILDTLQKAEKTLREEDFLRKLKEQEGQEHEHK